MFLFITTFFQKYMKDFLKFNCLEILGVTKFLVSYRVYLLKYSREDWTLEKIE